MSRSWSRALPWTVVLAASAGLFIALQSEATLDIRLAARSPVGHFYVVSAVAIANVVLGLAAGVVALRAASIRVLLLALSFISMSVIFAIHGLATPGFLVDVRFSGVTGFTSRLSLLIATAFLATSAVEWPDSYLRRFQRYHAHLLIGWLLVLASFAAVAVSSPQSIPPRIVTHIAFQYGATALVVVLASFAALRYFQGYRRSGLPLYGAVTVGSVLILQAQVSMHFGAVWSGTFWLYHAQLLMGFSAILWGVAAEYVRGKSPQLAIEQLTANDAMEQIRAGYTGSIVSLAAALEARDGYTIGHGERVAALAVLIAQAMGLSQGRLRALSQGALLHDIGKIGVPDAILHKPGALTDEEFEQIKEHPARGDTVLASAFQGERYRVERAVIRHHHERWDGSGYPDALRGETIPLEARVTAVADVYDALRSARSYRGAWTREQAQETISEGSGSHFDSDCVEAFFRVVERWETDFSADRVSYAESREAA